VPKGKKYRADGTTVIIAHKFNNIDRLQTGRSGSPGTVKFHFFCEKKYGKKSETVTVRDTVYRSCRNQAAALRQT